MWNLFAKICCKIHYNLHKLNKILMHYSGAQMIFLKSKLKQQRQSNLYTTGLCQAATLFKRPVLKVTIFRSYKLCICYLYQTATSIKRPQPLYSSPVCPSLLFTCIKRPPQTETKPHVILYGVLLCLKCIMYNWCKVQTVLQGFARF